LHCDYSTAAALLKKGRNLAVKSGDIRAINGLETNAGYIETLTGRFAAARQTYERILENRRSWTSARLGAMDGMARLALTTGALDACEEALVAIDAEIQSYPALVHNYNVRWSGITRVRLLIRRGDFAAAIECARRAQEASRSVSDTFLTSAYDVVMAQAFARLRRHDAASFRLFDAEEAGVTTFRELQAQYYWATADVLRNTDRSYLQDANRARANRVWGHHGIVSHKLEMGGELANQLSKRDDPDCESRLAVATNSLAAMFDTAYSPSLLGAELKQAVSTLSCSKDGNVIEFRGQPSSSDEHTILFPMGEEKARTVAYTCKRPEVPEQAIVLADVLRIAKAALSLESYRQEERRRAAVWPADPIETEAGALFLAEEMQTLLGIIRRIGPTNVPVLITGETGTGKEVVARLVHLYSNRAKATFLPFNCSASPKDMLDAQLFGHRRGAVTGATDNFQGVIRGAAGGTLFLDEIGETTLDVQPKLLRFLESNEVHPIGEAQPVKVDVRVIAATNADLDTLVSNGRFREDLLYRLNIVRLHVPPLRERRVEIPALANHYLQKAAHENNKGDLRLSEETMEYLILYRWPGNVRQLANEMRRLVALAEPGAVLMPEHLSTDIAASRRTIPASQRTLEPTEIVVRLDQPMAAATQHVERAQILWAMKKSGGGLEETAALLGISRKGLYLKRQRYAIETPPETAAAVEFA
jgi:DNA-binding NtrC family response regulator